MNEPVPQPLRGEVWLVDLGPARGHEQAGVRPAVIVSTDLFSRGPAGLAVMAPMTTSRRDVRWHVPVSPPNGGLRRQSFIKCEDVRSMSIERLIERVGSLDVLTMAHIETRLRVLLEI